MTPYDVARSKKFRVSGRAGEMLWCCAYPLSYQYPYTSILPPVSTIFETLRDATLRPTATNFFVGRALFGSRPDYLTFASTSRATHFCSTSMRSEGSAHTLATSTPKNRDFGLVAPRYAGTETVTALSSLTALQLPGSGRLPLVRRDGSPHSVKACVRLQCLCLPCRRLPGSVLGASPRHVRG